MANTVGIIIEGRDKSASKVFVSVGKAAEKFGGEIETVGKRLAGVGETAGRVGDKLTKGVTLPLTAVATLSVRAAMQSGRLEQSLEGLAGGADEAGKYIEAIQKASRGTVSSMDAMAVASRALSFGIVENADDMSKLTEIAITLGRAQGLSATQAVSDLTTALARQSPMILDNLGITLKLTDAYRIYADKLGVTADQLTAEQKQEAFLNAALIEGEAVMERMGGVQEDAAASAERLTAQLSDASVALGEQLLPLVISGAEKLTDMVAAFNSLDEGAQKAIGTLVGVGAAAGPALKAFSGIVSVAPGLGAGIGNVAAGFQLLAGGASAAEVATLGVAGAAAVALPAIVALTAVVVAAKKAHDLRAEAMEREVEVGDTWTQFLREQVAESDSAVDVAEEYVAAQGRVADELENASIMMGWFMDEQALLNSDTQQLARAIFDAADSFDDYRDALEMVGLGSAEVGVYTDEMAFELAKAGESADGVTQSLRVSSDGIDSYGRAWERAGEETRHSASVVEETGSTLERASTNYAQFADNMVEGVGRVGEAAEASWPSVRSLADQVLELGKAFTTGIPDADDMWNMVLATGRAAGMSADQLGALAVSMGVAERAEVEAQIAGFQIVEAWERGAASGQELIAVTQGLENYTTRLAEAENLEAEAAKLGEDSAANYAAAASLEQQAVEALAEGHDQRSARFYEEAEAARIAGAANAQASADMSAQAEAMRNSADAAYDMATRVAESGISIQEMDNNVRGATQGVTALEGADKGAARAALEVAVAEGKAQAAAEERRAQIVELSGGMQESQGATDDMLASADELTAGMGDFTTAGEDARLATDDLRGSSDDLTGSLDDVRDSAGEATDSMGLLELSGQGVVRRLGEINDMAIGARTNLLSIPRLIDVTIRYRYEGTAPPGPQQWQTGTMYAPGGMALVGEQGPELVDLPRGARVYPAGRTRGMLANAGAPALIGGAFGDLTVNVYGAREPQASADAVIVALRDRGMLPQTSYR